MSLRDAQDLFNKPRKMTLLGIKLKDESRGRAKEVASLLESQQPAITVTISSQFTEKMQDFATTEAILNTLILITLAVGGIVMTNAILMSVFERTGEIGVLRALGWRKAQIIAMVLYESLAVSLVSGILGILIGYGLNYLISQDPSMGYMFIPVYSLKLFIEVLVITLGLGCAGGIYPAWKASTMRPVDALRYE